jgi:hypothetical protein
MSIVMSCLCATTVRSFLLGESYHPPGRELRSRLSLNKWQIHPIYSSGHSLSQPIIAASRKKDVLYFQVDTDAVGNDSKEHRYQVEDQKRSRSATPAKEPGKKLQLSES